MRNVKLTVVYNSTSSRSFHGDRIRHGGVAPVGDERILEWIG